MKYIAIALLTLCSLPLLSQPAEAHLFRRIAVNRNIRAQTRLLNAQARLLNSRRAVIVSPVVVAPVVSPVYSVPAVVAPVYSQPVIAPVVVPVHGCAAFFSY